MNKILLLTAALTLCGCSLYKTFETPEASTPEDLLGSSDTLLVETPLPLPSWQEFFGDTYLQTLIEKGLISNSDLQVARLNIEQCQTMLKTSKLAYLPSIGVSASGGSTSVGETSYNSYDVPVTANWEIDLFGKLRNSKEQARANLLASQEYVRATELELTTTIANSYYTLIMLDEQLAIANEFIDNQSSNLEAIKKLKEVGMQTQAAVNQAEASLYNTKTTKSDLELQITLVENTISLLINQAPGEIKRANYDDALRLGSDLSGAISLELLSNRPDVKASEYALRSSFYGESVARSAMYPSLSLSGTIGWTNGSGAIANPGSLLLSALGQLTAPIFNRGVNRANLEVAKSRYEQSLLEFQKSLLVAGNEVNGFVAKEQKLSEKQEFRKKQIESNEKAYSNSALLMKYSSVTYLEVLVAQSALLQSRLTEVGEWMLLNQNGINLYKALGGSMNN